MKEVMISQAEMFCKACEAKDVATILRLATDSFQTCDNTVSDSYEVLCFFDGSRAGWWRKDGQVWLIS